MGKAACNEQPGNVSPFSGFRILKDGIDGFLLCIVDKSAGVDHHDPVFLHLTLMIHMEAVCSKLTVKDLGIDQVLCTTQCNDGNMFGIDFFIHF